MKRRSSSSFSTEDEDLFFDEQIFVLAQVISNSNSEHFEGGVGPKITSIKGFSTLPISAEADAGRAVSNSAKSVPSPTRSRRAKNYVPSPWNYVSI
jgi:hypothetical protein